MTRLLLLAAALCTLLSLLGCGSAEKLDAAAPTGIPAGIIARLPALPQDRGISGLTENLILGKNTQLRSAAATDQGNALELDPSASGFEWGLYGFDTNTIPLDSLSVLLNATGGAYVGLANYTLGHWEFFGPYADQKTLAIDGADYVSPGGNFYCVVISCADTATVSALSVRTLNPANELPQVTLTSDVASGAAPLTVQFTASATDSDGSIIEYAWDVDGDGDYDSITDEGSFINTFDNGGSYDVKVRVTDDQFGRATDVLDAPISVTGGGNVPPVADLAINPPGGPTKFTGYTLDASGSTDSDGVIISYEWDLDDNGSFETLTGTTPSIDQFQPVAGEYTSHVRVTDDDGAQDTADITFVVHGWESVAVAIVAGPNYNTIGVVNGHVAIAYYEGGGGNDMVFVRSITKYGNHTADWINKVVVDQPGAVGINPSLQIVNGNPAVSYYDADNKYLRYAVCSTPNGNAGDWTPVTVDNGGANGAGEYSSLQVVAGKPSIAYKRFDAGAGHLRYARSSTADGSSAGDWTSIDVDTGNGTGENPVLGIVNGKPAVSYFDSGNLNLMYVQSSTASGAASGDWAGKVIVKNVIGIPHGALLTPDGNPAIAYWYNGLVYYVRSTTPNGSLAADWSQESVINPSNGNCFMAMIGGKPSIAYHFNIGANSPLEFVQSTSTDGALQADWFGSQVAVDGMGVFPKAMSMCEIDGRPAIAWCDDPTALNYAILF